MPKTETFIVPSLADTDPAYGALVSKRSDLEQLARDLTTEKRDLEKEITDDDTPYFRDGVATLLGDPVDGAGAKRKRIAEIKRELTDIEAAQEIIRRRLTEARGPASTAVCAQVKPEYAKRVRAICAAMTSLDSAHRGFIELREQFVALDVEWTQLIPMTPNFLGDPNDPDRRIARYLREAKEAGYA